MTENQGYVELNWKIPHPVIISIRNNIKDDLFTEI